MNILEKFNSGKNEASGKKNKMKNSTIYSF